MSTDEFVGMLGRLLIERDEARAEVERLRREVESLGAGWRKAEAANQRVRDLRLDGIKALNDDEFSSVRPDRADVAWLVTEVERLRAFLCRIASSALSYDQRVYLPTDDGQALLALLPEAERATIGERPSEMTARLVAEIERLRGAIERVRMIEPQPYSRHHAWVFLVRDVVAALDGDS